MGRELIPNSTQIPDVILDFWLAELSGAELKILLYVARRTYGFGKESDAISLNQMAEGIRKRDGTVLDRGTGLSRSTVKATCAKLVERGVLIKVGHINEKTGEHEESTYRLNLDRAPCEPDEDEGVGRKSAHVGQKLAVVGRTSTQGRPEPGPGVGRKSAPQETVLQETGTQETAAGCEEALTPAAAELVKELTSQDLNRSDALRLALKVPDECRRQLRFLPFVEEFRSGRGAYLRRAIEEGFGPPPAYRTWEARHARELAEEEARRCRNARQSHEDASRRAIYDWLRGWLRGEGQKLNPEAFSAFLEDEAHTLATYQDREHRSPRAAEIVQTFCDEERRLERLVDFIRSHPEYGLGTPQVSWEGKGRLRFERLPS